MNAHIARMTPTNCRVLAILAACGFVAGVLAYVGSFLGAPVDPILQWGILPVIVIVLAIHTPIYVLEYPASRSPSFAWTGFARGLPSWVAPCAGLLALFCLAQFVWAASQWGLGVPEIQDGQYVLGAHSQILKVLTQPEYFRLKELELRLFAAITINLCFAPMMYWWYRRTWRGLYATLPD